MLKIDKEGNRVWCNSKGLFHRDNGPAVECANGDRAWYKNGKRHRINGPAIELNNGDKEWYNE